MDDQQVTLIRVVGSVGLVLAVLLAATLGIGVLIDDSSLIWFSVTTLVILGMAVAVGMGMWTLSRRQ